MRNILSKIRINNYTYIFIIISFLCGFMKNIIIIFSICIIHEVGHIFFIKFYKYKIVSINLYPFGGYTLIDKKINSSINKDIIIAFAGIFMQIILLLVIDVFKTKINIITYNLIFNYNILIMIFNLLPIIPLDGSKIIRLFLEKKFSFHLSYHLYLIISILSLIIFVIINFIYNIDNYFIIMFLIFELVINIKDYKYIKNRFLLERCLYDISYKKIDNNTKKINNIRKEVYHYFKINDKYRNEREVITECLFDNYTYF